MARELLEFTCHIAAAIKNRSDSKPRHFQGDSLGSDIILAITHTYYQQKRKFESNVDVNLILHNTWQCLRGIEALIDAVLFASCL